MSTKKHLDRLFQEKFKDFEAVPEKSVWKSIEADLNADKKKRRVIPLWWKLSGIAAGLILFSVLGYYILNTDNASPTKTLVEQPKTETETKNDSPIIDDAVVETTTPSSSEKQNLNTTQTPQNKATSSTSIASSTSTSASKKQSNKLNHQDKITVKHSKTIVNSKTPNAISKQEIVSSKQHTKNSNGNFSKEQETTTVTQNTSKENEELILKENIPQLNEENTITEALAENATKDTLVEVKAAIKRWSVSTTVAPVYFNSLGEGSSIDAQFNQNSKTGKVNLSYGVKASYAINDKLQLRAGVNNLNIGYNTNDVIIYNRTLSLSPSSNQIKTIKYDPKAYNTSFLSFNPQYAVANSLPLQSKGEIDQEIGFIEVPFELEYNIVKTKLGVNVIGGFSTFFLNSNKIYTIVNNEKSLLGEATNINNTSFSANFGLGVHYNFSKAFQFNLEPTFKYQINTFNNTTGNFRPYIIGVYSGLKYKF